MEDDVHTWLNGLGLAMYSEAFNENDPALRATVLFQPVLSDGEHTLEFFFSDAAGNSRYHREDFEVASELAIKDVLNYPNPLSTSTDFTYLLTMPAETVTLKIYTLAGRLIYSRDNISAQAGYNAVFWDGTDQDGDAPANGVYLYKIIARAGDRTAEALQKLIIMR